MSKNYFSVWFLVPAVKFFHYLMMWQLICDRFFFLTFKNIYLLLNRAFSSVTQDEVFKAIWKLKIPSKASVFAWRLIRDRLPTRNNLFLGVEINDASCHFAKVMRMMHLIYFSVVIKSCRCGGS